jgi:S1-C subfamily serine protease
MEDPDIPSGAEAEAEPPASEPAVAPPEPQEMVEHTEARDAEDGRNVVPLVSSAREPGRSLVATGCIVAVIGAFVSLVVGGAAGYGAARFAELSAPAGQVRVVGSTTDEPAAAAAAAALPSVVNIDVSSKATTSTSGASGLPQGHPSVPQGGTGSGVAYLAVPGGGTYILTNNHVVENADSISVTPADGGKLKGTLVGRDPETDIAVVKVDAKLPTVALGNSEKLVVGQMVVAIGSPFGLQHSVSSGIVSALHRALPGNYGQDGTGSAVYPLVDVIQTDAAINPGNSGGALVDRRGLLVGINTAIYSDTGQNAGIGFAIPAATATRIANDLIARGSAKHPFLGVEGQSVDDALAKERKLPVSEGAVIERVFPGTGAEKAGLKKNDVVVSLDGQPVRTMDDLILFVRRKNVGDTVALGVWRDGKKITIQMVVGDKPANLK